MGLKKFLTLVLLAAIILPGSFVPERANAGILDTVKGVLGGGDNVPTVDKVQEFIKNVLNTAAHQYARQIVSDFVKSTVVWANSGFQGNPVYVRDPKNFFLNAANNSADGFIKNLDNGRFGFLCSPFQRQIQLSIIQYYYQPANQQFQCTWTGIGNNLNNFLGDFSSGGWSGWFSMTQIPTNNVYGAGIQAQIALSQQVQKALDLEKQNYQINKGFLNIPGDCLIHNPDQTTINQILDMDNNEVKFDFLYVGDDLSAADAAQMQKNGTVLYNDNKPANACIVYGPTKTPGTIIQSELEKTLGSQVDQIVNAQDWDQIVSALLFGLQKRIFSSVNGLFSNNPTSGISNGSEEPDGVNQGDLPNGSGSAPTLSCAPNVSATGLNLPVTWSAVVTGAKNPAGVTFSWSGTEGLTGTTQSVTKSYSILGGKGATLTAVIDGVPLGATCAPVVMVSNLPPLTGSCQPAGTTAVDPNTSVDWAAIVSGGSGSLASAQWSDTSATEGTAGEAFGSSTIVSDSGVQTITASITYVTEGRRTASLTLSDKDPAVAPLTLQCTGGVNVGNKLQAQ